MCLSVSYIPCATSFRGKTGDIIILTYFEEGNSIPETHDNTESGDESYDNSNGPELISE